MLRGSQAQLKFADPRRARGSGWARGRLVPACCRREAILPRNLNLAVRTGSRVPNRGLPAGTCGWVSGPLSVNCEPSLTTIDCTCSRAWTRGAPFRMRVGPSYLRKLASVRHCERCLHIGGSITRVSSRKTHTFPNMFCSGILIDLTLRYSYVTVICLFPRTSALTRVTELSVRSPASLRVLTVIRGLRPEMTGPH